MDVEVKLSPPMVFAPLFHNNTRYYFLKGGRASGKSWVVADMLIFAMVANQDLNLVCLREVQSSIKHSSKKLISDRINHLGLNAYFNIQDQQIRCRQGRGIIIFNGLQSHTADSIKSLEGFDLCWIEEAQTITTYSLTLLTPTIRKDGAKIIFTYNPKRKDDPVYLLEQEVMNKTVIFANYLDNPYCPISIMEEAENLKLKSVKRYNHIYLGAFGVTEGLIFDNIIQRVIREDEIKKLECLQGMDFGYTNDPTTFCQNYIDHKNKVIYVYEGFYKHGLLNSEIASNVKRLKAHRHLTRGDSAEPKTIASLNVKGVRTIACEKGKDSIMAGIDYLLEFDIIVNSHLSHFMEEFDNYTWDLDKMTGKPTNKPIDEYNHFIDALRYSVSHLYKRRGRAKGVTKPKGM